MKFLDSFEALRRWVRVLFLSRLLPLFLATHLFATENSPARPEENYVIVNWQVQDGLPSARINDIVQTRDGYLWLATLDGLARFDGVRFERFSETDTPGLLNGMVTCLLEDRAGRLWYGTQSGEIGWRDGTGFHALRGAGGRLLDRVNRLIEARDGTLWASSSQKLLPITNGVPGEIIVRPQQHSIWDICAADAGGVWVLVDGGNLYHLEVGSDKMALVIPGQPGQWRNLIQSESGGIWVREGQCLRRWLDAGWVENRGVVDLQVTENIALRELASGKLIVGTYGQGLWLLDENGTRRKLDHTSGLSHDQVLSLCEDSEKNLWVGTVHGLNRISRRVVTMVTPADNWLNRAVATLAPAADGGFWVGTEGAGLYRISFDGQVLSHQSDDLWLQDYIRCVLEDSQKRIWTGLFGGNLRVRNKANLRGTILPDSAEGYVNALFQDSQKRVWVGTTKGALLFPDAGLQPSQRFFSNEDIRCFAEAKDGAVWLGAESGGLFEFKDGAMRAQPASAPVKLNNIHALHFDSQATLWIGTGGNGLAYLKNNLLGTLTDRQGLPDTKISDIQSDRRGNLWIGAASSLFRIDRKQLDEFTAGKINSVNCLQLGAGDGLGTREIPGGFQPIACQTADGRLWYVTSVGLVAVDPNSIRPNDQTPPLVIEFIKADDKMIPVSGVAADGDSKKTSLRLPAGVRQLEIHYTALSFSGPSQVRFRHRLEGFEKNWTEAADQRVATFTHLPPGQYTFEVTACNNHGLWNESGVRLKFQVLPFFWQTIWFKGLIGLAIIGVVWIAYRIRRARLLALEQLRQQIARDLHDEVGANLGSISLLTEVMELKPQPGDLSQIRMTANQTVDTLRDLVWIINPAHEHFSDLRQRLEQIAALMLASHQYEFSVDDRSNNVKLPLELRRNLPPLFKEILHNIQKHAQARQVKIKLSCAAGIFTIEVADDGGGFDTARKRPGNGLKNFQFRAAEMGGQLAVESRPGEGTRVTFSATITKSRDWLKPFN